MSFKNMIKFICIILILMGINLINAITLKVGVYQNEPLYYIDENKKPQGLFIDILEEIAYREQWEIEYVCNEWNVLLNMLENEEIDLLGDIAYTTERIDKYNYNKNNVFVNWGQIYSVRNSEISSFLDIEGKRVAGVAGDIYFVSLLELLKSFSVEFEIVEVKDYIDVFIAIENNTADVGTVNRMYGLQYSNDFKIEDTLIIFRPTELRFAAPKDKFSIILSTIDFHIEQMKKDKKSVYYKALDKYIAGNATPIKNYYKVIKLAVFWFLIALVLGVLLIYVIKKKKIILRNLFLLNNSIKEIYRIEENIPLPCVHFDAKGTITYINSSFCQFSGYKYKDVIGEDIFSFFNYFNLKEIGINNQISKIHFIKDEKAFSVFKNHFNKELEYVAISVEHPEVLRCKRLIANQKNNTNLVFEFFPDSILISDFNGNILEVNNLLLSNFLFKNKESFFSNNHTLWDIFDLQTVEKIMSFILKNKDNNIIEYTGFVFNANHDEIKVVLNIVKLIEVDDSNYEKTEKIYIVIKNVSAEEKIKKNFLLSTEFFKKLFENSPLSILILDTQNKILDMNITFENTFGYRKSEKINQKLDEFFIPQEYQTEHLKAFENIIKNGTCELETYRLHSDGRLIKVKLNGSAIAIDQEIIGLYAIYRDITEESLRLNLLESMQKKYDILIRYSQDIIALVDENQNVIDISDSFCDITGWSKSDFFDREKVIKLIHPEDQEIVAKSFTYILKRKLKRHNIKYRFLHKQGHYVWIDELGSYIENCQSQTQGVLFISRDISETKKFEDTLTHQKEFFGILMNYFEEGLLIINNKEEVLFINNSFKNWTEVETVDIINKPYYVLFDYINKNVKTKLPVDFNIKNYVNLKNKQLIFKNSNKRIICNISIIPFEEFSGNAQNIVIISDITKTNKLNLEMNKIKNIDTLRNYTLHLANDFNNVLTAIMGHISLLKMFTGLNSSANIRIKKAEEAAFKAIEITQKIFPLQNMTNLIKTTFDVSTLFKDIHLPNTMKLALRIPEGLNLINTNFVMLKEAIRILIENSVESILEKEDKFFEEQIEIEVNELNLKNNDKVPLTDGLYTIIKIIDNGIGINDDIIDDIFEPYFSTKNKEGFGLTKALYLLRLLSCHLTIESIVNEKTTATIYIPKTEVSAVENDYTDINTQDINIIFMDDEHLVQDIAKEFMQKLGFNVDIASNGQEVLENMKAKNYDFYILDLIVDEGMGGRETAIEILKINPEAKMLLTTGMKTEKAFFEYKDIGFIDIIEKPIDFYQLKNKILKYYNIFYQDKKS
ncbi:MAG: PAS domain S-box protein [Candidatus Cloacimonetes bacterium]|nr:PAS domain S-box protein [Candidatus Cloacimonadota bacterium]